MKGYVVNGILVFVVAMLISYVTYAQGTITYLSNVEQSSVGNKPIGSDSLLAASFITGNNLGGYALDAVQLVMADATGSPSGFTAMLYSATGTIDVHPGDSLDSLNGPLSPVTAGTYSYSAPSDLILLPNTHYYVVLAGGTAIANDAYGWSVSSAFSYSPSGNWFVSNLGGTVGVFYSSLDGASWTANQGNLQFALDATPIPEPASVFLFILGSGVFAFARRRFNP